MCIRGTSKMHKTTVHRPHSVCVSAGIGKSPDLRRTFYDAQLRRKNETKIETQRSMKVDSIRQRVDKCPRDRKANRNLNTKRELMETEIN